MDVATHGVCGTQDIGVESFESPYLWSTRTHEWVIIHVYKFK